MLMMLTERWCAIDISVGLDFEAQYLSVFQYIKHLVDTVSQGQWMFLQNQNVGHIATLEYTIIQFL